LWFYSSFPPLIVFLSIILFLLQNEDFQEEKISFGVEGIYIDSWVRRRIYDAFKDLLASGVSHHLQVGLSLSLTHSLTHSHTMKNTKWLLLDFKSNPCHASNGSFNKTLVLVPLGYISDEHE